MVKRKFVSTRTLQPGMKIDQAILDKTGRELIAKGAYLDDFQIEYLQKKSIGGIYVTEGEPDPDEIHSLEAQLPIPENLWRRAVWRIRARLPSARRS